MAPLLVAESAELHDELNRLIVRRLRIGLGAVLAGVLLFVIANHVFIEDAPRWSDGLNAVAAALVAAAFWLLDRPSIQARPVPFALLIAALICGLRAMAGVWAGDIAPTAILCIVVVIAAGVALPWGVWPQLASVGFAAAAIAANARLVAGPIRGPVHLFAAIVTALAVSIVLSIELQRNRLRFVAENLQRRRAEEELAQLNAELERRVAARTAELTGATRRMEAEVQERQRAAHEQRESQKRLSDILDNAPVPIYLKDIDGRYLFVNHHWESAFGMRREDAIGTIGYDRHPAEIADVLRANDRAVLARRQPLQVEETALQRGERHIYVSVKFPLFDSDGVPVGVCGISTDITAQKQAEAELRRSEAALSALVENTTDAIWSIGLDGVTRVTNTVFRNGFREFFGTEYDWDTSLALVPAAEREEMYALYARAFRGEKAQLERTITRDGATRDFLVSVHPIVENGVVTGATAFLKDISELRRAEERARRHQAELAHVLRLRTMGEMAAGLAHEINQPLGAIANYAQGCAHRLRTGSADVGAMLPIVEEIAAEALRAGEIIRRLRDLVRKERPQQELLDVNALVRASAQVIEPEARQLGIGLRLELAPELPRVTGDGIQIEQVVLNLLLNGIEAVRASNNGDRTVAVTTAPAGAAGVEVAIRDSGVGLPEPPADVFAPFFSTKPNGLGMGLSISRSIIEAHGGHLWAAHNADRGSTFRFTLSARRGDAA
jgi:PAS domain S-box-containing protein